MHTLNFTSRKILIPLCLILFCHSFSLAQMIQLGRPTDGGGHGGGDLNCVPKESNNLIVRIVNTSDFDLTINGFIITTTPANSYLEAGFEEFVVPAGETLDKPLGFAEKWGDLLPLGGDIDADVSMGFSYMQNDLQVASIASSSMVYRICPKVGPTKPVPEKRETLQIERGNLKLSPNPAKDQFTLEYDLEKETLVDIELYNNVGEKVKVLVSNEKQPAGNHVVREELSSELPSGVYYVLLRTGDKVTTKKLIKL